MSNHATQQVRFLQLENGRLNQQVEFLKAEMERQHNVNNLLAHALSGALASGEPPEKAGQIAIKSVDILMKELSRAADEHEKSQQVPDAAVAPV